MGARAKPRSWQYSMSRLLYAAYGAFQTGEPGQADYLFPRYENLRPGGAQALWIEFKALRKGQPEWHDRERLRRGLG